MSDEVRFSRHVSGISWSLREVTLGKRNGVWWSGVRVVCLAGTLKHGGTFSVQQLSRILRIIFVKYNVQYVAPKVRLVMIEQFRSLLSQTWGEIMNSVTADLGQYNHEQDYAL